MNGLLDKHLKVFPRKSTIFFDLRVSEKLKEIDETVKIVTVDLM